MTTSDAAAHVEAWEALGHRIDVDGVEVWVADLPAVDEQRPPVFVLHGFPTCSFDWHHVVEPLRRHRRVVLFDLPGFGLSAKPDRRYGIRFWADVAEGVLAHCGLAEIALVTHDAGDTVGGELLARDLDGELHVAVTERVVTNGSIYLGLAHLTDGQNLLLSLPDARFDIAGPPDDRGGAYRRALAATCSADHQPDDAELEAQWLLADREDGTSLLPRTIRYIEDRRAEEARFTGAIEQHPSPLSILWGAVDPIADVAMVDSLVAARPDARTVRLAGVGHYPMTEAPEQFTAALLDLLGEPPHL
ncbi:MAG TPA: alpha/beta hydrolase [Acidimicrobiales bacterium]